MKKVLLLMLAVTGLLFATSCSEDDSDATLTLNKEVLNFEKEGATVNVDVTTDATNWSAIGSADWIQVKADGTNKLVVVVAANETVYDRQGKILVVAGNANASIDVMQKGMKGVAEIFPAEVILTDAKGMDTFEIKATTPKWTAEVDAEWLKVEAKQHKAELILHFDQNEAMEDRMAALTITVGNDKTVIDVKQLGKMFFLASYDKLLTGTREDVMAFEESRKNKLDTERSSKTVLVYKTRSVEMFPNMSYMFSEEGQIMNCNISAADAKLMKANLDAFKQFLASKGYAATDSELIFENAELRVRAEIKFTVFFGMEFASVLYKPIIEQPKDMPTFTEFPYPYMEWGVMKDKIDAYEADNGGTFNEDMSDINNPKNAEDWLVYNRDEKDEGKTTLDLYWVTKEGQEGPAGLVESDRLMKDIDKVFFIAAGDAFLTKEFKKLCTDSGFKYTGKRDDFYTFHHAEKQIAMFVAYKKYRDIGTVVHMATFKKEEAGSALQILKKEKINNRIVKISDYIR